MMMMRPSADYHRQMLGLMIYQRTPFFQFHSSCSLNYCWLRFCYCRSRFQIVFFLIIFLYDFLLVVVAPLEHTHTHTPYCRFYLASFSMSPKNYIYSRVFEIFAHKSNEFAWTFSMGIRIFFLFLLLCSVVCTFCTTHTLSVIGNKQIEFSS